ncbi:hypothetical protein [Chitinimonas sp.]|uniref:hypothetical protein n=1 Tax=Chitinimonas sp. TaxID=1934313 RepID=UPI0035AF689F
MANVMLCYPNRIEGATLSGGGWTNAPLSAMQTRDYAETAVSTDTQPINTQFVVDLGGLYPARLLVLVGNLSPAAMIRFRCSATNSFAAPAWDSGWQSAWPRLPFGTVGWLDPSFWSGQLTAERAASYPPVFWALGPASLLWRYCLVEINDPTNPAGVIALGRAGFFEAFQPKVNLSYDPEHGHTTNTQVMEGLAGNKFFNVRPSVRYARIALDWLSDAEAFGAGFDLVRRQGVHQEVFYLYDPADPIYRIQRAFLGHLRSLPAYRHPSFGRHTTAIEIEELI